MIWLDVVPATLVCVAMLLLPGMAVTYALGLRGVAAWGSAPLVTVAATAITAVIAGKIAVRWSPWLPVVACAAVAVLIGLAAVLLRNRFRVARTPDPWRMTGAAALGLLPAIAIGALTIVRGFRDPGNISQTYDALWHYNAVAYILDSYNGSTLTLGGLGNTTGSDMFYPAAWHDVAAELVMLTGVSIPVAANVLAAMIAIVLWPLSCLLLARQIFGPSSSTLAVTGVLSIGFAAFPWALLGYGVLWPNALGLSLVPAALAIVLSILGLPEQDALGRVRSIALLPIAVLALGIAHPGTFFSFVVLSVFPIVFAAARRWARLYRSDRTTRAALEAVILFATLGGAWYWAATAPIEVFSSARTMYWAPFETPSRAVSEVILNATNGRDALWLLSIVVLAGVVACVRSAPLRWVVAGHAATGFLFMIAAALNRPDTRKFTGYWYNDSYRLAAMLPITGVILATAGVVFLAGKMSGWISASGRVNNRGRLTSVSVLTITVAALLVLATYGMYLPDRTDRLTLGYQDTNREEVLASARQQAFFERVKSKIPEDAVVANNPWNGSGLLWALADRRTLFPHFSGSTMAERVYLTQHLSDAATNPAVCAAARKLGVDYLLIGDSTFRPWDQRKNDYPGFADPGTKPGFELVDADGAIKLYRITACAAARQ